MNHCEYSYSCILHCKLSSFIQWFVCFDYTSNKRDIRRPFIVQGGLIFAVIHNVLWDSWNNSYKNSTVFINAYAFVMKVFFENR